MSNPASSPVRGVMMNQKEVLCYILGVLQNSGKAVMGWNSGSIEQISYQSPTVERMINMIKESLKEG